MTHCSPLPLAVTAFVGSCLPRLAQVPTTQGAGGLQADPPFPGQLPVGNSFVRSFLLAAAQSPVSLMLCSAAYKIPENANFRVDAQGVHVYHNLSAPERARILGQQELERTSAGERSRQLAGSVGAGR